MRSAPPRPSSRTPAFVEPAHARPAGDVIAEAFSDAAEHAREGGDPFVLPEPSDAIPTGASDSGVFTHGSTMFSVEYSMADIPPEVLALEDHIVEVELRRARCFGLLGINCPADPRNVFCEAAALLANDEAGDARARLHTYYDTCQPLTAMGVLGFRYWDEHELVDYPPLAAVLPWMHTEPDAYLAAMETAVRGHQEQSGQAAWGVTDGHTQFGPVSRRKLRFEIERLAGLIESVRAHGISDEHPPLFGTTLIDDRIGVADWVFDVRDGLHRCAVFAALGHTSAKMQVVADLGPPVRRSQFARWHGVQTGLFTEAEALRIFDAYFAGSL